MFSQNYEKRILVSIMSVCLSVRMEQLGFHWRGFHKMLCLRSFESLCRKFQFHYNPTKIMDTLHADWYTFMVISHSFIFRMRNVSDKICRENQNTYFVFSDFSSKIVSSMRKCGKNIVERDRVQVAIWQMPIACWIPKAKNTHSQYVIPIAFPIQKLLHERASISSYTYIVCLVYVYSYRIAIRNFENIFLWFWKLTFRRRNFLLNFSTPCI